MPSNKSVDTPKIETKINEEPLFIRFANFHFTSASLEEFFELLKINGIEIPYDEFFLYDRDKVDPFNPPTLTESEKEKISKEFESGRLEFRKLLLAFMVRENYDTCLETVNSYCAEVPIQFSRHHKHPNRFDIAFPSHESVKEAGWPNFILRLMALQLGKYLLENPATRIRACKNEDCQKFFTLRGRKARFCSESCKRSHFYSKYGLNYNRDAVRKSRKKRLEMM